MIFSLLCGPYNFLGYEHKNPYIRINPNKPYCTFQEIIIWIICFLQVPTPEIKRFCNSVRTSFFRGSHYDPEVFLPFQTYGSFRHLYHAFFFVIMRSDVVGF